jgi:hypothetical protein
MKYSNIIGSLAALLVFWACTQKWVYIETPDKYLTGLKSTVDNNLFGRPGILHITLLSMAILFFMIPRIWAKRINFLITALNLAWAIRNFFAIGMTCRVGTCPHREAGIYLMFIGSIVVFAMALLPKLPISQNKES